MSEKLKQLKRACGVTVSNRQIAVSNQPSREPQAVHNSLGLALMKHKTASSLRFRIISFKTLGLLDVKKAKTKASGVTVSNCQELCPISFRRTQIPHQPVVEAHSQFAVQNSLIQRSDLYFISCNARLFIGQFSTSLTWKPNGDFGASGQPGLLVPFFICSHHLYPPYRFLAVDYKRTFEHGLPNYRHHLWEISYEPTSLFIVA